MKDREIPRPKNWTWKEFGARRHQLHQLYIINALGVEIYIVCWPS